MAAAAAAASVRATEEAKASLAKMAPLAAKEEPKSAYDYKHQVDTCACGTCHKARVDSGTDGAYVERCKRNTRLVMKRMSCAACKATKEATGRPICMECHVEMNSYDEKNFLKMPSALHMMRQAYVLEEASWIATKRKREKEKEKEKEKASPAGGSFSSALSRASEAISVAAAKSGGVGSDGFAKELFAAMGTPHDSKCPHGFPFYACMPCSH
jgi:hypothetical protein